MHFWRENIDLIDSSWLVIQIMIWINSILIEPTLPKSHLYMPPECMMLFSVVYWPSYMMLTLIWKGRVPCAMQTGQGADNPGKANQAPTTDCPDLQWFNLHLFDFAMVQSDMHSAENILYVLNFDLFSG